MKFYQKHPPRELTTDELFWRSLSWALINDSSTSLARHDSLRPKPAMFSLDNLMF